jgi:predicted transcriptional regulator of viral defense system
MIKELFKNKSGYLHSKDIKQRRILQYELSALVNSGEVTCLRRGLYKYDAVATLDHWQELSLLYPKAVLCMHSAALYHNLTTFVSSDVHLAIGQKSKMRVGAYPPIQLYYWADKYFKNHISHQEGVVVYNIERTVCDIIRLKSQSDMEIVKEVCQSYLLRKDQDMNKLLKIAKEIDAYPKVSKLFEILI